MPDLGEDNRVTMKPLLGKMVQEAVKLALIDATMPPKGSKTHGDEWGHWTDAEKAEFTHDIYAIPAQSLAEMDPGALAQNVAVRLLGPGGWFVAGVYSGNATTQEVVDATFARPNQSEIDELAFDLGLTDPTEPEDV